MNKNKKDNNNYCWLILKASLGEFHVIAPELINFAKEKNLKLYLTFVSSDIEKNFFANPLYKQLAECYFEIVERRNIISFVRKNKRKIKYLFRDVSSIEKYSVIRSLKILLPNSKLILFPHAFAFYVSKSLSNFQNLKLPSRSEFEECADAFITFTEEDKYYFSKRFPPEIISVFTPLGLSNDWLLKLKDFVPDKEIVEFNKKYPKRVLCTIRHPHKVYLSEKNYFALLGEVVKVSRNLGYELFLKPHPRQDYEEFRQYCENNDLHVWTKDTYTSALFFEKVITFWSSASIDFAAFGIPSIEHFRYEKYHNQLIEKDGKLSSLYVNMGLSLPSSNGAELELAFKKIIENPQKVGAEQQKNLMVVYNNQKLNLENINFRKPIRYSFPVRLAHLFRLYYYIFRNK